MEQNLTLFLHLLAGVTISFSAVNLIIGLQKGDNKAYLILGLGSLCVSIYLLLFPFVINLGHNSVLGKIGMFFFLANFALIPWFLCFYTGYCRFKLQWILSAGMAISFVIRLIDSNLFGLPTWNIVAHITLFGSIWLGFKAIIYQFKNGDRNSSKRLFGALVIFSLLAFDDIIKIYFPSIHPFSLPKYVLPLDYFMVLFMVVMGLQLARDMQKKYQLERELNILDTRWKNFLEKIHLLVVSVDENRIVRYVNPYFLKLTGMDKKEVIGRHYINIFPEKYHKDLKVQFEQWKEVRGMQYFRGTIFTNCGEEKTIDWNVVRRYNENDEFVSSIAIGSDITDQVNGLNEITQLKSRLEEENIQLKFALEKIPGYKEIVGKSDALKYVLQRALQVAPTNTTVILEGETGVGKEVITNYIQQNSERKDKPFVKLNCAAIPATLLESELFGHVIGAFTGADRNKKGMVEMADGGTLFLDEIGEFPIDLQSKLLRFLQEGEFVPLGSEQARKVDIRIITATNRELLKEIELGHFRNDLYYRLYVYPITIPALRNRTEDIPELVDMFLKKFALRHHKQVTKISKLVIEELQKYSWPGNIRELENVLERAVIVSTSNIIKVKDLSPVFSNQSTEKAKKTDTISTLEDAEREHILNALQHTKWQVHGKKGAAELLGINASTLRSRMKKLDIVKP